MKISHLVLCGGLTFALLLSGCADSNTKTTSKKTVPRTTVVTTIIHFKRRLPFFHHRCAQRTELQCDFLLVYGFQPDRCPDFRQLPANLSDSVRRKAV